MPFRHLPILVKVQLFQKEREDKLAIILKERLQPYVDDRYDEFVTWASSEARRLSNAGTNKTILVCATCKFYNA